MKNNFKINFSKGVLAGLLVSLTGMLQAQSPTAPALDFGVFLKNGAKLDGNHSYGPIALGGDLTLLGSYSIATKNVGTYKVNNQSIGLLVGGKVNYTAGNQTTVKSGYVKIGNGTGSTVWYTNEKGKAANLQITNGLYGAKPSLNLETSATSLGVSATNNPVIQSGIINFTQAFSTMQESSTRIGAYTKNIELTNSKGDVIGTTIASVVSGGEIKVNLKTGINVLNATGAELNSVSKKITFNSAPDATHIMVINVNAPGIFLWDAWDQSGVKIDDCPYIIYNFYNTTNLQIIGNKTIEGTVFAPFADITKTVNGGHIEGQVIGLSFDHGQGEIRYANFSYTLPSTNIPSVTAPTIGATAPVVVKKATKSAQVSWTCGNGVRRLVIARKSAEPGLPTNGQTYSANATLGSGSVVGSGFVVYDGTGGTVTVTNLEPNSTYYYSVVEYNTLGTTTAYASSLKMTSNVATLPDADGDGVTDAEDAYPNDPTKAYNNWFPASGTSTLMFEDLWPYKGDYDFNDMVIDFKINTITNASNNIAEVEYFIVPRAAGSTTKNGFAFQLDGINPSQIVSVTGSKMSAGWAPLNSNGTEAGHATNANIIVFENAFTTFKNIPSGTTLINTYVNGTKYDADTIKVVVKLQANLLSFASLTSAQFNPYAILNQVRGKELHLADRMPSAKMDMSYLGTGDDKSNVASGKYFKGAGNLPWALNIVNSVPYTQERVEFSKGYTNFIKWAAGNGNSNKDWYLSTSSNRDDSKLYIK